MSDFIMKRNDTSPAIEIQLLTNAGAAIPIAGATVRFHMRRAVDRVVVIDEPATVVDAPTGIVKYVWTTPDTLASGRYAAEWEVTYSDGKIETFPNDRDQVILITPDIA